MLAHTFAPVTYDGAKGLIRNKKGKGSAVAARSRATETRQRQGNRVNQQGSAGKGPEAL